jgi:hypothetical protein
LNLITLVDPFDLYSDLENKWVWRDYLPSSSAITPGLSKILDRMVATTLNKRYQSVGEVIKDLDRLQGINAPSTKSAPGSSQ